MQLGHKRFLVLGVASEESIAWPIALGLRDAGAQVVVTYQQRFRSRILPLLRGGALPPDAFVRCDVTEAAELDALFAHLQALGPLDGLVHSLAFAPPECFVKPFSEVSADEFAQSLIVSAHSLALLARRATSLFAPSASIVTLSYLGAQRVIAGYRVMGVAKAALEATVRELAVELGPRGVRVNAISAGPVRTLSAQAVPGFSELLARYVDVAPLRRLVEPRDIAAFSTFLLSDAARCITGQTLFLDAGFSILGVAR